MLMKQLRRLSPDRSWGRFRWLLTGLFLARGVALLCVLPPFEGWDEYQHVACVVHVAETGSDPILGETVVPASLLRALPEFPQSRNGVEQLGAIGVVGYEEFWRRTELPAFTPPPRPLRLYQAQHSPLYYRCVAGLFSAAGGTDNLRASVAALRLLNLGLATAALWLILGRIGRLCPGPFHAALLGLLIAAHPLFLVNAVRVANDAMAVLLATIVILWLFDLGPQRLGRRSVAFGLMAGLAVLAKVVNLALLPLVACVLAVNALQRRISVGRAAGAATLAAVAFLAVTATYFRANLSRLGVLIPMQEHVAAGPGRDAADLLDATTRIDWPDELARLWGRRTLWAGGWSFVPAPRFLRHTYEWLLLAALLGWAMLVPAARRDERWVARPPAAMLICLLVGLAYTTALAYYMARSRFFWGANLANPWYAAAALPWYFVLVYQGGVAWSTGYARYGLPAIIVAVFIATEVAGVAFEMVRAYTGLDPGWEALERLARLQPAALGTPTLLLNAALAVALLGLAVSAWILGVSDRPRDAAHPPA